MGVWYAPAQQRGLGPAAVPAVSLASRSLLVRGPPWQVPGLNQPTAQQHGHRRRRPRAWPRVIENCFLLNCTGSGRPALRPACARLGSQRRSRACTGALRLTARCTSSSSGRFGVGPIDTSVYRPDQATASGPPSERGATTTRFHGRNRSQHMQRLAPGHDQAFGVGRW